MGYFHVIDAHSIAYRAAYAPMPNLTGPNGEPTKALFGYVRVLDHLCRSFGHEITHAAVCFDASKPKLLKRKVYPAYKDGRKPFDPVMGDQLKRCLDVTELMGFACVREEGYEADDAIGAVVRRFRDRDGVDGVVVVTCDKDMMQLMSRKHDVHVYHPFDRRFWTLADVENKWGVKPSKVLEVMTLCGDPTDNVKGVPGIGPKTAARMVIKHGSARAAAEAQDLEFARYRAAIDATDLAKVRHLMTLLTDCPIPRRLGDYSAPDNIMSTEVRSFLGALGFNALPKDEK